MNRPLIYSLEQKEKQMNQIDRCCSLYFLMMGSNYTPVRDKK